MCGWKKVLFDSVLGDKRTYLILTPISCFPMLWKMLAPSEQLKVSESSKVLDSLGYHPRT